VTEIRIRDLLREPSTAIDDDIGDVEVGGVAYHSARVSPGDVFFCVPGFVHDGHEFAVEAARSGAAAIVCQREVKDVGGVPQMIVEDTRIALAHASAAFFGHPSHHMSVVGITGTNGKTTTTYLVDNIARVAGRVTGLVGTVETRIADRRLKTSRTTPESADLQYLLLRMREASVDTVAMEVSSHAIDLHRVAAVRFAVAAFTNLSQDHFDYHHTIEEYFSAKRRLFTDFEVGSRVINIDDILGAGMALEFGDALTVGRDPDAAIRAVDEELSPRGTRFTLLTPIGDAEVDFPLAAGYNVENALVATGCALALGIPLDAIAEGLSSAPQVPGRLERIDAGQPFEVFVDYAHTPDSLGKTVDAVRSITPGRVIVVFGCGGDRDPDKRPVMGLAAGNTADHTVITSDNPRSEDPVGIILQIEDGMRSAGGSYEIEVDRRKAIAKALGEALPGDAVLIAGKGHEDYQIFADRTIRFDDREVTLEELQATC